MTKVLATLERLGLVERLRPVTASSRSKKLAYVITDHFLRFHYRFVEPAKSQLRTSALAAEYVEQTVLPQLDHHASLAWEDVCRQHVLHTVPGVSAVGRWWGHVPTGMARRTEMREIDVVGVDSRHKPTVVGMCKWASTEVDFDALNLLDRLTEHLDAPAEPPVRYLFSRSGFSARLRSRAATDARLRLVTPADTYQ